LETLIAYVDGFSFYHGITKNTPYRWCNIFNLISTIFPEYYVKKVYLFAGKSRGVIGNPRAPMRQEIYFRALNSIPEIEVRKSNYARQERCLPLKNSRNSDDQKVHVKYYQEKQVDVNLAITMVTDGLLNQFHTCAIVTNDTDFVGPIEVVRQVAEKEVYLVPTVKIGHRRMAKDLAQATDHHVRFFKEEHLKSSLLPKEVVLPNGKVVYCPDSWL
jgi:uncharacterized LabA/DUF88 family protein